MFSADWKKSLKISEDSFPKFSSVRLKYRFITDKSFKSNAAKKSDTKEENSKSRYADIENNSPTGKPKAL